MFVQMEEFPSMYSRPLLSRNTAACPSTKISGSCSWAHHSRMSVNGCQTNRLSASIRAFVFHSVITAWNLQKRLHQDFNSQIIPEAPNPNFQIPGKVQSSSQKESAYPLFEIIDEKIRVNSRASAANVSRAVALFFAKPASINRKNSRLSFASFRQIFTCIRKSLLLRASSASIRLAATEPEAHTNCLMSSVLLTVRGNCFTKARTDCANSNVLSSRSRGLPLSYILRFET